MYFPCAWHLWMMQWRSRSGGFGCTRAAVAVTWLRGAITAYSPLWSLPHGSWMMMNTFTCMRVLSLGTSRWSRTMLKPFSPAFSHVGSNSYGVPVAAFCRSASVSRVL